MTSGHTAEEHHDPLGRVIDNTPLTKIHTLALILVVTGGLFEVMEQLILSALGPSLQDALGIGAQDVAWLSTATLLAIAVGGIVGGYFADRIGRRNVLALSVGIYSLGSLLSAFAPDYAVLILTRVVTGIGVGGEIAVGLTYLSELTPTKIRGLFTSLFNTISAGVGMFVAYAYTLWILGSFAALVNAGDNAWRWAFGLLGIPAVLVFFFRRYLPESPRFLMQRGKTDELNKALTRLADGRMKVAPEEIRTFFSSADTPTSTGVPGKAPGGSGPRGGGSRDGVPGLSGQLTELLSARLRSRTIGLSVCALLAWGAQFSVIILMPLLLVDRGYSISGSLTFTMVQNVGGLIGAIVASAGAYVAPRRRTIGIAAVLAVASIMLFAFFANSVPMILLLGAIFQFCVTLVNTTIWTWSPELFPTHVRGFGTAIVVNIGFVGGALIPLASTWLFDSIDEMAVFSIVAAMYVVILIASRFVTETHGVSFERLHGGPQPRRAARPSREQTGVNQ